jgi:hypothetical protein
MPVLLQCLGSQVLAATPEDATLLSRRHPKPLGLYWWLRNLVKKVCRRVYRSVNYKIYARLDALEAALRAEHGRREHETAVLHQQVGQLRDDVERLWSIQGGRPDAGDDAPRPGGENKDARSAA